MKENMVKQACNAILQDFQDYLVEAEKSKLTIEKYLRDVKYFFAWWTQVENDTSEISKREVLSYKAHLVDHYATASANSMLSSLNCFLKFYGRSDCCVKTLKLQRSVFCSKEKELSREEYIG